ncbi:response regulator transcription factor [Auritidibacter ignavus]|uniref:response regulator transcription factor n=1 Tax=Auritidibacter ignavus TaxID=678932 RepID=UPI002448F129|nr:response regulator transcription factor [Auritidibacter ignavus]WGH83573.1 response regulator transcription factor [Auritidibacter ignavus]
MPRLVIVDDHAAVRAGVTAILTADPEIEVLGEAATGHDTIEAIQSLKPDVVVLDLQLPDRDGIDICREITATTATRVLILTAYEITDNITAALDAGATGFLAKTAEPQQMIDAVHAVAAGQAYLTPSVTRHVIAQATGKHTPAHRTRAAPPELTDREQEVLQLVAEGLTNKQIAQRLVISPATAKTHLARIMQKLGVSTRTQAAMLVRAGNSLDNGV